MEKDLQRLILSFEKERIWKNVDFKKILSNLLKKEFKKPENFDELGILIKEIEEYVNEEMEALLEWFDENFKNAFKENRFWAIWVYEDVIKNSKELSEQQKDQIIKWRRRKIRELIMLKQRYIRQIILSLLKKEGYFNSFLKEEEISDLINLIESGFLEIFDTIFIDWEEKIDKVTDKNFGKQVYYWGVLNWQIVSYAAFVSKKELEQVRKEFLRFNNIYFKRAFLWFIDLILRWCVDYNRYIELEENNVIPSWKKRNDENNIKFLLPLENYYHQNFIDPEIEIHLIESTDNREKQQIENLSKKYFWSSYGMDKIDFYYTELILGSWRTSFAKVLWRSFPNNKNLSDKHWKIIYLIKSRNLKMVDKADEYLSQLWLKIDKEIFKNIVFDEVKYHEFGHSLFLDHKYDSILEELKATLYYFLYIYNNFEDLTKKEIENLIYFVIYDFVRRIPSRDKPHSKPYWVLSGYIFKVLVDNNLIIVVNNELKLDINNEKFKEFLNTLKITLNRIKEIYELSSSVEAKRELEKEFLKWLDQDLQSWVEFFKKKIKF